MDKALSRISGTDATRRGAVTPPAAWVGRGTQATDGWLRVSYSPLIRQAKASGEAAVRSMAGSVFE